MDYEAKRPLMEQIDKNLLEHTVAAGTKEGGPEILDAYLLQGLSETHYYLKVEHDFKPNEVAALLQFTDPLVVARECWEERDPEKGFPICDLLNKIKAYDRFPLVDPAGYAQQQEQMENKLNALLDQNMADFHASLLSMDKEDIIAKSGRISIMQDAYDFIKEFEFKRSDVETLLRMENPLEFVANQWPSDMDVLFDMAALICAAIDEAGKDAVAQQEAEQPAPVKESASQDKSAVEALNALLDKNMADFDAELVGMDAAEIAELQEVTSTRGIYNFIRNVSEREFEPHEAEILLRMENPLQFIVDHFPNVTEAINQLANEAVRETGKAALPQSVHEAGDAVVGKKPSVLKQIKANKQEVHQPPPSQERTKGGEVR